MDSRFLEVLKSTFSARLLHASVRTIDRAYIFSALDREKMPIKFGSEQASLFLYIIFLFLVAFSAVVHGIGGKEKKGRK